ncbi:MAG: S-methyl-5-thioribose-1-phosphate isomerase [Bdellovibrionia bacterium]
MIEARNLDSMGLRFRQGCLTILDQQLLPHKEVWLECRTPDEMIGYIKALKVRGAPLIGVAAALSLAEWALRDLVSVDSSAIFGEATSKKISAAAARLRAARPTAVNLMNALDRMTVTEGTNPGEFLNRAIEIFDEDVALCEQMAAEGTPFINDGDGILTHCNSGGLATVGRGTALGVITKAFEQGKKIHVYVDETRPLLQGARLTTWELGKLKIPHTLICDNMAGALMRAGRIQKIFVGADRIALNGDFANKIGTYPLAVLANYHKLPFYVVAPSTTVDRKCATGAGIPIEDRDPNEVRGISAPAACAVFNPAFDVTPHELVTGYIGCSER